MLFLIFLFLQLITENKTVFLMPDTDTYTTLSGVSDADYVFSHRYNRSVRGVHCKEIHGGRLSSVEWSLD